MSNTDLVTPRDFPIFKVEDLAYAYKPPQGIAKFKTSAADFIVRETLSFEPEGEGTHAYLYIEKENTNTEWLARQLARFVGVEAKEIGYAGLKDRNAVSSQWFSINLEITKEPNWDDFQLEGVKILKKTLHKKKLKRGAIKHNSFKIVLRDLEHTTEDELRKAVQTIQFSGVPNYFAQQRFGHDYNNLFRGAQWFNGTIKIKKRSDKSMIISAARSMIFNQILSQRIQRYGWNKLISGDIMMLSGTHSIFSTSEIDDELTQRFQQGDIHPTAALWGRGRLSSEDNLLILEQEVSAVMAKWCTALEQQGLRQERRSARVFPENIGIEFEAPSLEKVVINFSLPTGSYATAVLREIIQF